MFYFSLLPIKAVGNELNLLTIPGLASELILNISELTGPAFLGSSVQPLSAELAGAVIGGSDIWLGDSILEFDFVEASIRGGSAHGMDIKK